MKMPILLVQRPNKAALVKTVEDVGITKSKTQITYNTKPRIRTCQYSKLYILKKQKPFAAGRKTERETYSSKKTLTGFFMSWSIKTMRTITKKISVSFDIIVEFEVDETHYTDPDSFMFCKALNNWSHLCMKEIKEQSILFLQYENIGKQIQEEITDNTVHHYFAYDAAKPTLKPLEKTDRYSEGEIEFEFNMKAENLKVR